MGYETYRIADLIDEIAMGPFGSNIKVSCFVDSGVPVLMVVILRAFLYPKRHSAMSQGKKQTLLTRQMHIAGIL